jgi:hypothetical protein
MNEAIPTEVLAAVDTSAIIQLILRERTARDLGYWEQMRDCFHEDSRVRLSWIDASGPEFVERSKDMVARNVRATHRLGPILVTLAGTRAIATLAGIVDLPLRVNGIAVMLASHVRFLYRLERRANGWGICGLDAQFQRDEITPADPGDVLRIDPAALKPLRPSYRLLAYCIGAEGFPVRDDLPGDDRPDLVASLIAEAYAWAWLSPPR